MKKNNYKNLWLHNDIDNEEEFIIAPYTTLNNIKVGKEGNFSNFFNNYIQLQNNINKNINNIEKLEENLENLNEIIYGLNEPSNNVGKNGDLYIQHNNTKIIKIWQKVNNKWFQFVNHGTNISIKNISNNKPQINGNITISKYPIINFPLNFNFEIEQINNMIQPLNFNFEIEQINNMIQPLNFNFEIIQEEIE